MNLHAPLNKSNSRRTESARRRDIRWLISLVIAAVALLPIRIHADERNPRLRAGADESEEFPSFELKPLLPGGRSSDSALPPIDDADSRPIPRRTPDPGRFDSRSSDPRLRPFPPRRSESTPITDDLNDPRLPAEMSGESADEGFDWSRQPVTMADLEVGHAWVFDHTKPNLTDGEIQDYIRLIRAVNDRRASLGLYLPDDVNVTSAWESAFYRYADARRQAWLNGALLLQPPRSELSNPFDSPVVSAADQIAEPTELKSYSLTADMRSHPSDFVGRPVVLYGLFTPSVINELQATKKYEDEKGVYRLQRGFLRNLSNTENIALVDAESYVEYDSQSRAIEAWPVEQRISYPVLVKGWFVKLTGGQPLIYCNVVRVLTPRPYDEYIRENVRNRRRLSDDESWLYFETLRQLQITSSKLQAGIALADQQRHVESEMREIRAKAASDRLLLEDALQKGTLGEADPNTNKTYQARLTRLDRQVDQRLNRYREYQQQPEKFPMFVDIFLHPDRWQGHLVTLHGHVRRVTSHDGDSAMFGGQPLHELWLFTDDSQHNPTVIVTPTLPDEFPRNADDVDSVTVTGCLFKMYVYRSQKESRIAPLLLAGRIDWKPTTDQILALGDGGHMVQGSRLLATAKANSGNPVSDTMMLLFGFIALLATMTVWGRVQRDRRERDRLKLLVDERPDFRQTSQDMYSGPFAESRYEPTRG
jgi:hypothetical protein